MNMLVNMLMKTVNLLSVRVALIADDSGISWTLSWCQMHSHERHSWDFRSSFFDIKLLHYELLRFRRQLPPSLHVQEQDLDDKPGSLRGFVS